jgi:hypothetical protein
MGDIREPSKTVQHHRVTIPRPTCGARATAVAFAQLSRAYCVARRQQVSTCLLRELDAWCCGPAAAVAPAQHSSASELQGP